MCVTWLQWLPDITNPNVTSRHQNGITRWHHVCVSRHEFGSCLFCVCCSCMQVGDTERWGHTGFDDDGQLVSASLDIYHVSSRLSWNKVGSKLLRPRLRADDGVCNADRYWPVISQMLIDCLKINACIDPNIFIRGMLN